MVLRDSQPAATAAAPALQMSGSRAVMGPLSDSTTVQNNRGRLRQRFDLIRKLGQGTYGKVQLGIDRETGQEVAIKTIKKSKIETEADLIRIQREIQIMSSVRHPNIIHIYEVFENRDKMVLVMEYAAGGELYDYLNERKTLKDEEARRIFRQIASATYYCHKHNICHRDLKLENILLDEKANAKIADFGLSNVFSEANLLKTFCGSPLYASPEIVRGTPYYGPEVDCWSLGVLLYTLVYGAMPFDGSNFKRLVRQISTGDYYEPSLRSEASNLIRLMLTVDPLKRGSIKDVCSHPWLNRGPGKECLVEAEELANETPVRLDLLLSLGQGQAVPATAAATTSAVKEKKTKREAAAEEEARGKEKVAKTDTASSAMAPPTKQQRKQQAVKKKSKSSPLLELIVDVEEEKDDGEEADTLSEISEIQSMSVEDVQQEKGREKAGRVVKAEQPSQVGAAVVAVVNGEKEKSAHHKQVVSKEKSPGKPALLTPEAPSLPSKAKDVEGRGRDKSPAQAKMERVEEKVSPTKVTSAPAAPPETVAVTVKKPMSKEKSHSNATATAVVVPEAAAATTKEKSPSKPTPSEPKKVDALSEKGPAKPSPVAVLPEPTVTKVREKSPATVKVEQELKQEPKPTVVTGSAPSKEKSPKPATPEPPKANAVPTQAKAEPQPSPPAPPPEKEPARKLQETTPKVVKKKVKPKTASAPSKEEAASASADEKASSSGTDNEFRVQRRSENITTPPVDGTTRVERRNSKIISQKTAELIQNLEAKTSPDTSKNKIKFPSLKVSDVKSRFEGSGGAKPVVPAAVTAAKSPTRPKPPPTSVTVAEKPIEQQQQQTKEDVKPKPQPLKEEKQKPSPVAAQPKAKSPAPPPAEQRTAEPVVGPQKPEPEPPAAAKQDRPKLQVKIIPIQHEPQPVQKPAALATAPAAAATPKPEPQTTTTKTPLSPSEKQQKEQAAKKIGSVIQRIVSSESVEKGLDKEQAAPAPPKTYKTEIQKFVNAPAPLQQKPSATNSQERIIPIQILDEVSSTATAASSRTNSGASLTRFPPPPPRHEIRSPPSISRQNSSDTESSLAAPPHMEPLKKSPREFIIPIKVEASGCTVQPREELLESSSAEDRFRMEKLRPGRFSKRFNSLLSDSSEGELDQQQQGRTSGASLPSHSRSLSQGDEPATSTSTFNKRYRRLRSGGLPLDKSDSFSSDGGVELDDDEDTFEVLTAESLFSSLLDRVRNLTRRLNRENSWGEDGPLAELMGSRSSELATPSSSYSRRSYSREPSVTVTITHNPAGSQQWRKSLSRDVSGDSMQSDTVSRSSSINAPSRSPYDSLSNGYGGSYTRPSSASSGITARRPPSITSYSHLHQQPIPEMETTYNFQPPSRASYRRTLSNSDYNTTSVTLPLRRPPARAYDRTMSNVDYSHGSSYGSPTSSYGGGGTSTRAPSVSREFSREGSTAAAAAGYSGRLEPSSPYSPPTRYGRSLSRYSTPEPPERRFNGGSTPLSPTSASGADDYRKWIGGTVSTSTRTSAAAAQQTLSDPPPPSYRRFSSYQEPDSSPTIAVVDTPRWPQISTQKHRPVSIQNFPSASADGFSAPSSSSDVQSQSAPVLENSRPFSPTSLVRMQAERLTSPPPPQAPAAVVKAKPEQHVRATSVDKITRLLEGKSAPPPGRVRSPTPGPPQRLPTAPPETTAAEPPPSEQQPAAPSQEATAAPLEKKPPAKKKFFHSLEKKWEKFTNGGATAGKSEEPSLSSACANQQQLPAEADTINESNLLQRAAHALEPKQASGGGRVSSVLGRLRKFEGPGSKKPPPGGGPGRRVQSVYAGACSDSVLTLPLTERQSSVPPPEPPNQHQLNPKRAGENEATSSQVEPKPGPPTVEKKRPRPLSLGIFSVAESKSCSSFIPRPAESRAPAEPPRLQPSTSSASAATASPPSACAELEIRIDPPYPDSSNQNGNGDPPPQQPSPTSSASSEKNSNRSSILDEEESVSDRILRKSFYTRFNPDSPTCSIKRYSPNRNSLTRLDASRYAAAAGSGSNINKYNPNPLFKELISERDDVGRKAEYSRRVTSKLSKLLRDIEQDSNGDVGA